MPQPPRPRKTPFQARARASVEAVVEAAARVLEEGGAGALNTNKVAERAGVSVGTLYQYFPHKEAIVAEIVRRERRRLLAQVEAACAGEGPRAPGERLRALIGVALDYQFARPRLARALEHLERDLYLDEEAQALSRAVAVAVHRGLQTDAPGLTLAQARDCVAVVRALADAASLDGEEDREPVRRRAERAVEGLLDLPWSGDRS